MSSAGAAVEMLAQRGVDELRQLAAQLARDLLEERGLHAAKVERSSSSVSLNVRAASFVCSSASNASSSAFGEARA